jgi:nucleoside-diphosphate-sugar epimerase
VIDACIACGVEKLIFASSCEAANGTHTKILTTKDPVALTNPASHYGFTKGLAEQSVLACMLIWGPGDKQFYELSKKLKFNSCIGDGENYWETAYVDNVCHGFWLASKHLNSKSQLAGKKYYISDESPIKMKDFMTMFFSTMQGKDIPTQFALPVWAALPIAYLLEWICWLLEPIVKLNPLLTSVMVYSSTVQYKFDISDAKKDLKYSPIVSMKEGMIACKKYAEKEKI